MKEAVLGAKESPSAGPMDQIVVPPTGLPSASIQPKAAPPQSCTSMPRCRLYQACIAFGSLALKKMPPIPVTRFMCTSRGKMRRFEWTYSPSLSSAGSTTHDRLSALLPDPRLRGRPGDRKPPTEVQLNADRTCHPDGYSSEGEAERFDARVKELDLEPSTRDRLCLPDQLIHPLLYDRAIALRVDISSLGRPCDFTVEPHAKWHTRALLRRSHDEVHVARVELIGDPSVGSGEGARVGSDRPVTRQSPTVEPQARRRRVVMSRVEGHAAARVETVGMVIPQVALRRSQVLPVGLHLVTVRVNGDQSFW